MLDHEKGLPRLIDRKDVLLVVIDAQERLMPIMQNPEETTENIVKLLKFASIAGIPAVLTEQEKLGRTLETVMASVGEHQLFGKVHFNCFSSDGFRASVEETRRKVLVLAGIEAHICVAQTALYAVPSYTVHVVGDAVSSRAVANKTVALERMSQCGVTLSSTEMFIYEILGQAGTEEFKATLRLVK
jgi:nicotinamidase-related amidase